MSKVKVAINGFGRIGRNVFKIALEREDIEIVGINDLTDNKTLAHLLKYDSTQGKFNGTVEANEDGITVNGKFIKIDEERNPANIKWGETPDVVIESTGVFRSREGARGGYGDHLKNGAKKVILTVPAKDQIDKMIVLGVNDEELKAEDLCVSNASCTTNCLAPVAKVLMDKFGLVNGLMTTVHSYTNDQSILDAPHGDLRRARSCAVSQIPTTTGAAKAVGKVLPQLAGKLDGMAVRVPTPTGSMVDLVANLEREVTVEEVNAYCEDPIVSVDVIHNSHSSIFDAGCTMAQGKTVKIVSWYDNEWGYSTRVVDLIGKLF